MKILINEPLKLVELHYDDYNELVGLISNKISKFNPISRKVKHLPKFIEEEILLYETLDKVNKIITFKLGFIYLLYMRFKPKLSESNRNEVLSTVKWDLISQLKIDNLNTKQREDLKCMLDYKLGINQVYTSYGKSEVIATISYRLQELGYNVLLITSSAAALGEIKTRVKKLFGYVNDSYYDINSNLNFINGLGYFMSNECDLPSHVAHLKSTDFVIFDEVEMCMSATVINQLDTNLINRKATYGFSATSNKDSIERLSPEFESYLAPVNLNLVKYLGYSLVYEKPGSDVKQINIIEYQSGASLHVPKSETYTNTYLVDHLYTTDSFTNILNNLLSDFTLMGCTFIPINSKKSINYWISRLDKHHNILFLSAKGYQYYEVGKEKVILNIDQAKALVVQNKVRVFFTTSSGYNSIDFKGIHNMLLVMREEVSSSLIQAVGRSREYSTNVIHLRFKNKIVLYDSKIDKQIAKIKKYYEFTNILTRTKFL